MCLTTLHITGLLGILKLRKVAAGPFPSAQKRCKLLETGNGGSWF